MLKGPGLLSLLRMVFQARINGPRTLQEGCTSLVYLQGNGGG